jgi:crotonobetainyl-CoA:carnitine CoA-transferase CaiB-like acyl-CoA transferase
VVPKLSGTPGAIRRGARWTVGADTDAVLGELGLGEEELARLRDDGVI